MSYSTSLDANHTAIKRALKSVGASVVDLSGVGGGVPDLLVGMGGRVVLMEVKTAKGKLRATQIDFSNRWKGPPVLVVRSVEDALRWAGVGV